MVEMVGSNKNVLDVGCATGYLAKTLKAFGNTVTGLEYDPEAAERARQFADKVVVADLDHSDLTDVLAGETFDVIVFGDVLEHLRDPLPPLRQARSLLAPGGYIVISIPNVAHGDVRMSLLLGRFTYRNPVCWTPLTCASSPGRTCANCWRTPGWWPWRCGRRGHRCSAPSWACVPTKSTLRWSS